MAWCSVDGGGSMSEALGRVFSGRDRPSRIPWDVNETCYFWKESKKPAQGDQQTTAEKRGWHGIATVAIATPTVVWLSQGKLLRCPPELLRKVVPGG